MEVLLRFFFIIEILVKFSIPNIQIQLICRSLCWLELEVPRRGVGVPQQGLQAADDEVVAVP